MKQTTSDLLVDVLYKWGVRIVFGLPGDGINGIIEAFRIREKDIRFIQVRHEEAAAFMASAYAKLTGKLGVCIATSGPGAIHLLNGLYDAKLDGAPVLAITGLQFHDLINTHTQQDVELDKLFENVSCYNTRVMGPAHIENAAHLACRTALTKRGVAHLTIPVDFQDLPVSKEMRSKRNVAHHEEHLKICPTMGVPSAATLQAAADVLNKGKKIVIFSGRGAIGAGDLVESVAKKLGAVICKPLLGKGSVPDESPYCTGSVGMLGTKPSQDAIEDCDTLLMIGSTFPYIEFYPDPQKVKCVQIDLDPSRIGLRHPVDAALVGDTKTVLDALLPLLQEKTERKFLETAQEGKKKWVALMEEQASFEGTPMKPQTVAFHLNKYLNDDAIILCDSGTIASWYARYINIRKNQMCTLSGNLASMACGLPYAIAAQIAFPERQVVAIVGDGGFSMLMAEMATAKKYNLPIKIIIIKNNSLGMIKWEQMVTLGNPEYVCDLQPMDFVKFAEVCGVKGYSLHDPKNCATILNEALALPGPAIVECLVDPFEPIMPAKIEWDQAKNLTKALVRGTKDADKILKTLIKDKVRELT
jgi:pyruvate dehydrogenase (quinone)